MHRHLGPRRRGDEIASVVPFHVECSKHHGDTCPALCVSYTLRSVSPLRYGPTLLLPVRTPMERRSSCRPTLFGSPGCPAQVQRKNVVAALYGFQIVRNPPGKSRGRVGGMYWSVASQLGMLFPGISTCSSSCMLSLSWA